MFFFRAYVRRGIKLNFVGVPLDPTSVPFLYSTYF